MSDNEQNVSRPSSTKFGIKHPRFTLDGKNGESHRKNAAKKKAQYLRNVKVRADVNARRSNMGAGEYHSMIAALSGGNA